MRGTPVQGYLTYKKTPPPKTLPQAYAQDPTGVLGGGGFSDVRGTPVQRLLEHKVHHAVGAYRGYSKLRARTALGSYSRAMPRSIGPPKGRCVSLISNKSCTVGVCLCA